MDEDSRKGKPKATAWTRIKVAAAVELIGLVMALVVPITPSKTGARFHWPATWVDYFGQVLLSFLLVNGLFVIIFIGGWIYWKRSKARGLGA